MHCWICSFTDFVLTSHGKLLNMCINYCIALQHSLTDDGQLDIIPPRPLMPHLSNSFVWLVIHFCSCLQVPLWWQGWTFYGEHTHTSTTSSACVAGWACHASVGCWASPLRCCTWCCGWWCALSTWATLMTCRMRRPSTKRLSRSTMMSEEQLWFELKLCLPDVS